MPAMGLFQSEVNHFGLDIGTTGIRLIQTKESRTRPVLITYGALSIDPKLTESEAQIDQQKLVEAIKKLVSDSKVSTKSVVVGLPSNKVFASIIDLPHMSQQELAKSIKYQAEQYIPMPLEEVRLDWAVLSQDEKQMEVLLIAAPLKLAERYLKILEAAGLDVVAIEPDAIALSRSLVSSVDTTVVVLDVGARSSDLVIVRRANPTLLRSVPIGGDTIVRAATQNLNLDNEQAMQFVYKFGLSDIKLDGQVKKAIKATIDSLISEVDKSIKFLFTRYKDEKIEKLVLTGKTSHLPELPVYLANSLNLPVEIGNPWVRISMPADTQEQLLQLSSQFSVAAGLAIREEV